ncbi:MULTISPECIES: YqaA family protein [unclassified Sphingobium]|uniref:YqaA family protein n=1 Tax=unclassified Sphingobium TaxID=2611147 RepID=UPI0007705EBA|nr:MULTISPECIES: YqaA family protein [unclassified Sphingobium]AMK22435.1 DedA-family protein [Sphingobium sp. TKS]NML90015.1 DedA family protein [Sphingobium sp. TB-6]
MLTKLYQWTLAKAAHAHAERWLFIISFLESSFFPIPPHPLLGLMCLARPERAIRFGLICTIASVMGGLLGYAIGHFVYEAVGQQILHALGLAAKFPVAACYLRDYGAEIILIKGATPIPFKLITITAGFIGLSLFTFLWASILSRAFQFMLVGFLFWKFGRPIKAFIEKYLGLLSAGFLVLVIGGFIAASALSGGGDKSDRCSHATMASLR